MKAKGGGDGGKTVVLSPHIVTFDHKRDAYGFPVRPQHVHRYREYANIYKEEEEERSDRWKVFLGRQAEFGQLHENGLSADAEGSDTGLKADTETHKITDDECYTDSFDGGVSVKLVIPPVPGTKTHRAEMWTEIRPSLRVIEDVMGVRVEKKSGAAKEHRDKLMRKGASEEDSDEEFYDLERTESDSVKDVPSADSVSGMAEKISSITASLESLSLYKDELECLVRGGVPMALRGELWQAFVGVRERKVDKYYHDLLSPETDFGNIVEHKNKDLEGNLGINTDTSCVPEKWKGHIEKLINQTPLTSAISGVLVVRSPI